MKALATQDIANLHTWKWFAPCNSSCRWFVPLYWTVSVYSGDLAALCPKGTCCGFKRIGSTKGVPELRVH